LRAAAVGSCLQVAGGIAMSLAHHKLIVWQRADDLFIDVHRLTLQSFPAAEKYELGSQLRRSAYSVPANIVEGSSRDRVRDRLRFLNIASASLSEVGYGLHAARRLGYISDLTYDSLERQLRAVSAPLNGLIKMNRRKLTTQTTVRIVVAALAVLEFVRWL
jgi:four helix bundle protein